MSFWNSWQLWEKMCFVLGTSIIAVIALGAVKLGYSRWRLRKYTAIAATKEAQQKEMQHSESTRQRRAREIPFGVRAIESGIEVDGVWISRSNTPGPSVPGSPALSMISGKNVASSERPVSSSNIPRLEMPQPAHHESLGSSPARSSTSSRPLSSSFDRAVSAEIIPSRAGSSEFASRGRATYQPRRSSHLRYSNSHDTDNDNSQALAALEGRQLATTPGVSRSAGHENSSSAGSWSESSSSEGHSGYSQPSQIRASHNLLDPADAYSRNAPNSKRRALDNLPSQRRSHTAETGQLLPRGQGTSGDWTEATTPAEHRYTFAQHPSPYHDLRDPFATPGLDERSQEPPSFQNFVHQAPPSTRFDLIDDSETIHAHGNQNLRQPQTARKINSGFEILRPGTLDRSRQSSDIADWQQDLEAGNKRQSRRLQRKRGDSNGTESRFTEEV